jgi:hypothetical protein
VYATGVSDVDVADPPDAMAADYVFTFTTLTADAIFVDGFETGDVTKWTGHTALALD